ncbi:hypothetical protein CRG98_001989 [Punica granatum]|uniref:DUF7745 domain-containing protein n=1 Tax=Punica granatum TaxID=22663 RepID=A0A2I0LAF1_PUNGR|nr:hypothetical protein CRG98_001989 [Punica granatum]
MPSTDPNFETLSRPGTELAPTIEEYTALIQRSTPTTQGIFVPNPFATIRSQLSNLLGIPTLEIHQELHQGWDHGIRIAWLSDWTLLRALTPSTASYQRDTCHGFLLLVFGTLLFPYSANLIDGAIAQVVLQAVGGHRYMEALLAETVQSLDYVREGLVPVIPPLEHSFSKWRHFWPELTPARFLWVARWNPSGPMITGCPGIVGVPLLSHLGSTLVFTGWGSTSSQRSQDTLTPRAALTPAPKAESSAQAAMHTELRAIREERDRLRCELADSRTEVANYRELQTELARARARVEHLDREMARLTARHTPGVFGCPSDASPAPDVFRGAPSTGLADFIRLRQPSPHHSTRGHGPGEQGCARATNTAYGHSSPLHQSISTTAGPHGRPSSTDGIPHFRSGPIRAATCFYAGPGCDLCQPWLRSMPPLRRRLFLGMRLPSKFKIPEFKTYEGMTDPRHHLRHYRGKMLQYWEYEEFVIHSFQDSLSGFALDWFMSLRAEDIPTWEDLSRKFINQYRYCAEAPPTLLELNTKEMAQG